MIRSKHPSSIILHALICTLIFTPQILSAQNRYPAAGDALIHGLTIGAGGGGIIVNTALGDSALVANINGNWNTAAGYKTLFKNTYGSNNTAVGYEGLYSNISGFGNTAVGDDALFSNQIGFSNVAVGLSAITNNTSGQENTSVGNYSLWTNSTGSFNTATGEYAMYYNTTGSWNTAVGQEALESATTGNYNTAVGSWSGIFPNNITNATGVGYNAVATASNSAVIGNTMVTSIGGYANWTNFSDGRYKKNINRNVPGLAFINKLDPITYTLDINGIQTKLHANDKPLRSTNGSPVSSPMDDPIIKQAITEKSQIIYTGFIAQDVEKTAQSIGYNFSGVDKPKDDQQSFYGLRYSDFVVPLVKAVQELSAQNDSLKATNAQLSSRLDQVEQLLGIHADSQNTTALSLTSARLFQNSPNPFNQNTLISYYLPQSSGSALVQITGMNGQTIKTIALNGAGYGQLNVQSEQLAAGIYTYSLIVNGTIVDTKKMVLTK